MSLPPFLLLLIAVCAFNHDVSSASPSHGRRVVCYLASWAVYFEVSGRFEPLDAERAAPFCTHIVLLFALIDETTLEMGAGTAHRELIELGGISNAVRLKEKFPHLKIMICLGGWTDGSVKYSRMARDPVARSKFVASVEKFLVLHKLDGIDLNWQFPGERGGKPYDKANIVTLVKELREVVDRRGMILSVAVSAFPWRIEAGFDGKGLADHAHFLNVLSYEYHAQWDKKVGPSAPIDAPDQFSLNNTIERYLRMGVDERKMNLGFSGLGTTYVLSDATVPDTNIADAPITGAFHGQFNNVDGFIAYNELCAEIQNEGWTETWDNLAQMPYARNGARVASVDNPKSFEAKIKLVVDMKLGGVIFYGLEKDDFKGSCSSSNGPYPLLRTIHEGLLKSRSGFDDIKELVQNHNANFFWNGMQP